MQDEEDCYLRALDGNAREFSFPAGCVPGWGDPQAGVSLAIFNRNVVTVGKSLLLVSSGLAVWDYTDS
jgi:hypothetical protein